MPKQKRTGIPSFIRRQESIRRQVAKMRVTEERINDAFSLALEMYSKKYYRHYVKPKSKNTRTYITQMTQGCQTYLGELGSWLEELVDDVDAIHATFKIKVHRRG